MRYLYLVAFIAGLLLAVRLMFFGAERRRARPGVIPLRRSEPAVVGFLVAFGLAGYLLDRSSALSRLGQLGVAIVVGVLVASLAVRLALAMTRSIPDHDPDDPRYVLQGHVGVVTAAIPGGGTGRIEFSDPGGSRAVPARSIDDDPIDAGMEVCIERIEDGIAFVERWSLVEARL